MHRTSIPKTLKPLFVGATIALALSAIGSSAAFGANESRVTFVNGIPGKAVDICLDGKEVTSGLKYGAVATRLRDAGTDLLKVFAKDPRTCKGTLLGTRTLDLNVKDLTVVATKKAPKIVVFDNTGLIASPPSAYVAWRVAADLGPVTIKYITPIAPTPAADPVWQKGDQLISPVALEPTYGVLATRPNKSAAIAGPRFMPLTSGHRVETILVGTNKANAKLVGFSRLFWPVPI